MVVVRDRDITSRECTTIAIRVATTGDMEPKIVCESDHPVIEAGNTVMVRAGRAVVVTPTGRQVITIAAIQATGGATTAPLRPIAPGFHFAREMPVRVPIRRGAERERRKT